jgi:hypothetical protein
MTSDDLTPEQWAALKAEFARMLRYRGRLNQRLNNRKFSPHDPLTNITREAYNSLHKAHSGIHYLSCDHGVGRPARERHHSKSSSGTLPPPDSMTTKHRSP